jgi:hypothetical protein
LDALLGDDSRGEEELLQRLWPAKSVVNLIFFFHNTDIIQSINRLVGCFMLVARWLIGE